MNRRTATLALTLASVALAGCGEKKISDIDAPSASSVPRAGPRLPSGVVAHGNPGAGLDGLYPATAPDERCCWLAPVAAVETREPAGAMSLEIDVLVPDYVFFEAHHQTLAASAGGIVSRFPDLAPGVHRLHAGLRPSLRPGLLRVRLATTVTFVPAREGLNADRRRLGIILLNISAK